MSNYSGFYCNKRWWIWQ